MSQDTAGATNVAYFRSVDESYMGRGGGGCGSSTVSFAIDHDAAPSDLPTTPASILPFALMKYKTLHRNVYLPSLNQPLAD